jgi:hypothetical protein
MIFRTFWKNTDLIYGAEMINNCRWNSVSLQVRIFLTRALYWDCRLAVHFGRCRSCSAGGSVKPEPVWKRRNIENYLLMQGTIIIGKLWLGNKEQMLVGKYPFVNRTIKSWNQSPAGLLASFPCKLNTFRYRVKGVVTSKGMQVGIECIKVKWCGVNWRDLCEVILFWSEVNWSKMKRVY